MPELLSKPTVLLPSDVVVRLACSDREDCVIHLLTSDRGVGRLIGAMRREIDPYGVVPEGELEAVARLAALEALRRFRPELGVRFSTFVYWPIRGAMIRHAASYGSECPDSLGDADSPDPLGEGPFDAVRDRVDRDRTESRVRAFVAQLPSGQREIVHAVFWEDCSHAEVAAARGVSRQAVGKALMKALARGERELVELAA